MADVIAKKQEDALEKLQDILAKGMSIDQIIKDFTDFFRSLLLIKEGVKNVAAGGDPMAIKRGIDKAVEAAVEGLKDITSEINGKEDIARVATVSSGDEVIYEDVLAYEGEDESYEIRVRIPEAAVSKRFEVEANGEKRWVIPITFRGSEGAGSARVFGFIYTIGVNELEHWN